MYIQPNTTVKLLKDVPLDKSYEHTIYFNSRSTQTTTLSAYAKYTLNNQTYQRVNKGVIRVNYKPEDIYDCNYMMFQNTNFGTKWFYAFIDKIEYVNNVVSEVSFTIDVMQTWLNGSGLDYEFKPSFVERQHTTTDVAGDNLVPENLELGDYVASNMDSVSGLGTLKLCLATPMNNNYDVVGGGKFGGFNSAVHYRIFDTIQDAQDWLDDVPSLKYDYLISMFLIPEDLITVETDTSSNWYGYVNNANAITSSFTRPKYSTLGSYTPKNKKLLTYPYNFLYISNLQGNGIAYPYEYFSTSNCEFNYSGGVSAHPEVLFFPRNYKGINYNYDERFSMCNYPEVPFSVDSYKTALANVGISLAIGGLALAGGAAIAGGALAGGTAAATGAAISTASATKIAGLGAVSLVSNALSQTIQGVINPIQTQGQTSGAVNLASLGLLNLYTAQKHIRPEFAGIIDDYFSKFGYAIKRVQVPNIAARPHWTFVKTISCDIEGSIPQDDLTKIREIYDAGITFWKSASEVGNYSLDNSPT